MASILSQTDSKVVARVYLGKLPCGKQHRKTKTFNRPDGMKKREWERYYELEIMKWEKRLMGGDPLETLTLADWIERWRVSYGNGLAETTLRSYEYEIRDVLLPSLGHMHLESIRPYHISEMLLEIKNNGGSQRACRYPLRVLSSIMTSALENNLITSNPCLVVKPPEVFEEEKIKHFSPEQARIFLELIKDESITMQVGFSLALFCGLRLGECLGLKWSDIDLDKGLLSVRRARYVSDVGMNTKSTKNRSSMRVVTIPNTLIDLLYSLKKVQRSRTKKLLNIWKNEGWVLCQYDGSGMYYSSLTERMKKIIDQYNEDADDPLPHITMHGLRHTSATYLISRGLDIQTVSSRLGHSTASTTMNVYSHFVTELDQSASDVMDSITSS